MRELAPLSTRKLGEVEKAVMLAGVERAHREDIESKAQTAKDLMAAPRLRLGRFIALSSLRHLAILWEPLGALSHFSSREFALGGLRKAIPWRAYFVAWVRRSMLSDQTSTYQGQTCTFSPRRVHLTPDARRASCLLGQKLSAMGP